MRDWEKTREAMKRYEVIPKALEGKLTWIQAAEIFLNSQSFFVWDDFISCRSITVDYQKLYDGGSFKMGDTGNASIAPHSKVLALGEVREEIRKDETYWLDPLNLTASRSVFWDRLEDLKKEINEHLFLGLWSLDGHYSPYPINGHYQKHQTEFCGFVEKKGVGFPLLLNTNYVFLHTI